MVNRYLVINSVIANTFPFVLACCSYDVDKYYAEVSFYDSDFEMKFHIFGMRFAEESYKIKPSYYHGVGVCGGSRGMTLAMRNHVRNAQNDSLPKSLVVWEI